MTQPSTYSLALNQLAAPLHITNTEFQQKVTANINDQQHHFLVAGKITEDAIQLIAFTPAGITLFTAEYHQNDIHIETYIPLPIEIPANAIIQDLQLAFWPLISLQSAINSPWQIEEKIQQRTLYNAGVKQIAITYSDPNYWQAVVELSNYSQNYKLTITTLFHQKLP